MKKISCVRFELDFRGQIFTRRRSIAVAMWLMREEIWTEKIFKDDAGYYLRITYIRFNIQTKDGIVSVSSRKQWCYSREGMIYSLTNTNSLTSYSSGIVIYSIRTTIGIQKSSFTLPYFIRDHLGSVRTVVDGLMLKTPSPISGRDKSTTRMEMINTCIIQKRKHSLTRHAVLMTCSRIRMLGKQLTKV